MPSNPIPFISLWRGFCGCARVTGEKIVCVLCLIYLIIFPKWGEGAIQIIPFV